MKIGKVLGATKKDIEQKKFNIWIGISLGNKFFSEENIREYIQWSLKHTKEDVLVIIGDRLYAITLEVTARYNAQSAWRKALQIGNEIEKTTQKIIQSLPANQQAHVKIIHWNDIVQAEHYQHQLKVLFDEFKKKGLFYDQIIAITQEHWSRTPHTLTQERLEKLAEYFIIEIPAYLNGVKWNKVYNLQPYPTIGDFDFFLRDVHAGEKFADLTKLLKIDGEFITLELR